MNTKIFDETAFLTMELKHSEEMIKVLEAHQAALLRLEKMLEERERILGVVHNYARKVQGPIVPLPAKIAILSLLEDISRALEK